MTSCTNCGHEGNEPFQFCPSCGTAAAEPEELCGKVLNDKYRIVSELGSGTMGTVYLAEHVSLEKKVALKVLHRDLDLGDDALKRFRQEGIAAGKFTHQHAIQIFDFDESDNTVYLAMEYVEGDNLKQFLRKRGKLDPRLATDLISQVLSALAEAHQVGIVHRDLKPDNIMVVTDADDTLSVKVLDFGLSKLLHRSVESSLQTQAGRIMGTPLYMAPEQWDGEEIDHRIDLYAAGLILYEMLAGSNPFDASSFTEILKKTTTEQAPSLIDSNPDLKVPSDLDIILQRALAKDADDRFQSAIEMSEALAEVKYGRNARRKTPSQANLKPRSPATAQAAKTGSGKLIGVAILLLLVAVPALWFAFSSGDRPAAARVSLIPANERSESEAKYLDHLANVRRSLRKRDAEAAHAELESAMEMPCKDAEAFFLRAEAYRLQKDDDTARADYSEAMKLDPDFAVVQAAIGQLEYDANNHEAANAAFYLAYGIDQTCAAAIAGIGTIHLARGEITEALSRLLEAAKLAPDSATIHCDLGYTQLAAGDFDAAAKAFIAAKRNDPRSWRSLAGLGAIYSRRERTEDAIAQLSAAARLAPAELSIQIDLASLYASTDRHKEALTTADTALQVHPDAGALHLLRGIVLYAQDDYAAAQTAIEQALTTQLQGVSEAKAHLLLGTMLHSQEQLAEAAVQYEATIKLDDQNSSAHLNLGLLRIAEGAYPQAEAPLEKAISLSATNPFAHRQLGVLHRDFLGNPTQALEHFETAKLQGDTETRLDAWISELQSQLGR